MTNVLANLARMSSSTTGTGTLTLDMAAQGCLTFAESGVTNGQIVSYAIEDYDTAGTVINREVGAGTYSTAGPTLGRTTVYASTNSNNRINCSGRQHVFITALKEDFSAIDAAIASATSSASTAVTTATAAAALAGAAFAFGSDNDEPSAVPGPRGQDGASGSAGPQGPMGPPGSGDCDFDETAIPVPPSLGTAAFAYTGASGHTLPFLDVQNTFSANQLIVKTNANLNIVASSGDATNYVAAVSGQAATFRLTHWTGAAVSDRWLVGKDAIAESGGDVGSKLAIYYYTDAGAFKGTLLEASRVDGSVNFRTGLYSNSATGGSQGANTLNFTTLYENGVPLSEKYGRRDSFGAGFAFSEPGEDGMMGPPGPQGAPGAAGGGGGGLTLTTVEKDLGSVPVNAGTFTIAGSFTAGKAVLITQAAGPYTNKGTLEDEAEMDPITATAYTVDTTTIRAYWHAAHGPVQGNVKFNYAVSA